MALVLKDRVLESSTSTGTGTFTLTGAQTGYQSFSVIGNGNTVYYTIQGKDANDNLTGEWEVGTGTWSTGNTLSRDTVLESSNANAKVVFSAGSKDVFCDLPAEVAVYQDALGTVTAPQLATSSTTSTTPTLSFNGSNTNLASGATVSGSYLQSILQNKSGTAGASTNYVLSNDLGTDSTYYGEFGMNSSVYSSGTPADFFSLNNGIYYSGHDGDISLGSGNGYKTYFAWGTVGQSAHVINASGAIGLNTNITGTTNFGTAGQVLTSAGSSATPTWTSVTATAGGSTTQVQYNNAGSLAGSANFTFNGTTVTIANDASISGIPIGKGAGAIATNTVVGLNSFLANTTGSNSVAMGNFTLRFNTTGYYNTAIGVYSLYYNTTGISNSAYGYGSLSNNTTASSLTAIGYQALTNNTTNVATLGTVTGGTGYTNGTYTGVVMTLSSGSTAVTYPTATIVVAGGAVTTVTITSAGVGFKDTTTVLTAPAASIGGTGSGFSVPVATLASGTQNTAVGYQALYTNTVGNSSSAFGYQAGFSNTTGTVTAFGNQALQNNTTGDNTAFGGQALRNNTTGTWNIAVGYALPSNTTGSYNVGVGRSALSTNTTGAANTAVGYFAGNLCTASSNTFIGASSGASVSTGGNNTLLGYQAGATGTNNLTTGSTCTLIGYNTAVAGAADTNEIVIGGNGATGLGSNTTVIGNSSTTLTKTFGVHQATTYTVATLPSASTSGVGARAFVTDALAPTFGATVVTGGAIAVPVYSDGSAWKVG